MIRPNSKVFFYIGSFLACSIMALSTGCASGGFKLTREYAGFVNKQNIIVRIIIYLLTGIIFAITMLVDLVIFNTIDFWEGRVSQGTYEFNKDGKTFHVRHEISPENSLKRSTIEMFGVDKKPLQEVVLQETPGGEIEMSVDGELRARVRNIGSLPVASIFDRDGHLVSDTMIFAEAPIATLTALTAR